MEKILNWLLQPYPYSEDWRSYFANGIYASILVTLFLLVFRPFGAQGSGEYFGEYAKTCIYFGLVTMLVTWVYGVLSMLWTAFFNEESWTVWREILSMIMLVFLIGTANFFLAQQLYDFEFSAAFFWHFQKYTLLVALVPLTFSVFIKQRELLSLYRSKAENLNENINQAKPITAGQPRLLVLKGENIKEQLELDTENLLYVEAADNYVKVVTYHEEGLQANLLRSSLKNIVEQLKLYQQFFRCHRTFIVNIKQVESVSGNAQGYKLHLQNSEQLIPVSRSLNKQLDEILAPFQ